ncbi:hypothetical protein K503DRAFT_869222 [Rhizopogon vinicolor AM-OR11-026]|uniref:Uncharacterized protein n=1 Tax=Rhizopogon vinicolor AM-OR11-026 TaxID=1314800 RepID=A0A1B7MN05_9AGAM|nr:hypothetical protein K503DRAFT_869222 [Rhizopogon vinicolor AM-OR11-026]
MNRRIANFYRGSQSQFPMYLAPRPGGPPESHPPQVSPLLTHNGSFETLLNFSPPPHAPSPTSNAPTSNPYATGASALHQMMPTQHVELLRQIRASADMQCFPHVVNLAVQLILKIKDNPVVSVLASSEQPDLRLYADALENDPIGKCHEIISACRHSGQRCRPLQAVIEAGNANGYWRGKLSDGEDKIPVLRLLQDCPTRWSSTFKIIDRVLILYPAIQSFIQEIQNSNIAHLSMDSKDLGVLRDIHQIIEVSHAAQELPTAERTPTLSMALSSYELLKNKWSELKQTIWELSHYIDFGLDKLTEYIHESRKTRIYALAMIINPSIKLEWMLNAMTSYRASIRSQQNSQLHVQLPQFSLSGNGPTSAAAQSLMTGFGHMTRMNTSVRRSSFTSRPQTPL